jgi:hypothetical protein
MSEVTYPEFYGEVFAAVARPLIPADAVPAAEIAAHERRLRVRLPEALRAYYEVAGNMHRLDHAYNSLAEPAAWRIDRWVLVFLRENQGLVKWGVAAARSDEVDPPALYTVSGGDGAHSPWAPEDLCSSDFLVLMLCWQAVHGGMPYTGWAQVGARVVSAVAASWGPAWQSRDLRAYYRPGQVLCLAGPGSGEQVDILVGGRTEGDFEAVAAELSRGGVRLEPH